MLTHFSEIDGSSPPAVTVYLSLVEKEVADLILLDLPRPERCFMPINDEM
jgi:hypothetical protein